MDTDGRSLMTAYVHGVDINIEFRKPNLSESVYLFIHFFKSLLRTLVGVVVPQ